MQISTQGGSVLELGFEGMGIYMAVGNPAWQTLQLGRAYYLSIEFRHQSPWLVSANVLTARSEENELVFRLDEKPAFQVLRQFTTEPSVVFYYKGRVVTSVPLGGSREAAKAMSTCESTHGAPIQK